MRNERATQPTQSTQESLKQVELLHKILHDNKKITKELKIQLDIIENLERDKTTLTKKFHTIQREAELCKKRDELNARRNAALVRENKLLKQKYEEISLDKMNNQMSLEKEIASVQSSYEERLEDMEWSNDRLGIDIVAKDAKLEKIRKGCKQLVDKNKRMRKMLLSQSATNTT